MNYKMSDEEVKERTEQESPETTGTEPVGEVGETSGSENLSDTGEVTGTDDVE
jgi:hypothetical protein